MTGQMAKRSTVAVLTPRGRGAVATIRFTGDCQTIDPTDHPLFRAANKKRLHEQPIGRICFGYWSDQQPEEVVLCRISSDVIELHCHGGDAAVDRIVDDLKSLGCQVQSWFDSLTETTSVFEAELQKAVSQATTLRTAEILLRQQSGLLFSAIESLQRLDWDARDTREIKHRLDRLIDWIDFGLHLTTPWDVVIAGRPNVGKSSLINALLGFSRSIVFDQPGTTRDVVHAETAFQGWPVRLADTAGIRDPDGQLEAAGIKLARKQLETADCRILLFDCNQIPYPDDHKLFEEWPNSIVVAHKCDLTDQWQDRIPESALRVSSLTGDGLDDLVDNFVGRLIPEIPAEAAAVPVTKRQTELLLSARSAIDRNDESGFRIAVQQLSN